jgi:hydrogenase nickel incorporation protein HypA/HybF
VHEFSIAESLVNIVRDVSDQERMEVVESVYVRIGSLSCVEPEALVMAYQMLTVESPLESSKLEINKVKARATCGDCAYDYAFPEDYLWLCPRCNGAHVEVYQGREMIVDRIVGQAQDGH